MKIEFEVKQAFLELVEALWLDIFIWKCISAQALTAGRFFVSHALGPGIPATLDLEEGETFCDMRNKIVRQLHSL